MFKHTIPLLQSIEIENIRFTSFDIKFTRLGFEDAFLFERQGKLDIKRREPGILFISLQVN